MPASTSSRFPRLLPILMVILLVLIGLHLASIAALRYLVESQLHPALPKGTRIGEIHLNPLSGVIEIRRFYLRANGVPRIRVDRLLADVDPLRLLLGTVVVERVVLEDGYVMVERRPDGAFDLGLPEFAGDPGPSGGPSPDVAIRDVEVSELQIEFRDADHRSLFEIDRLKVGEYTLRSERQVLPVELALRWDSQPIAGNFEITLDGGDLGVAGSLATGLLDLAQAQRLARLEPQVLGNLEFDGRFVWNGEHAEIGGALAAPGLQYQIGGRGVSLRALALPAFKLELDLDPGLEAELHMEQPLSAEAWTWSADGQGVFGERGNFQARVLFRRGGEVLAEDASISASALAWNDQGRSLAIEALQMAGRASQQLSGDAVLPGMALRGGLAKLRYTDEAARLTVEVERLSAENASLSADDDGPARQFAAQLTSGPVMVEQGANAVQIGQVSSTSSGLVSMEAYQVDSNVAAQELAVATPALPNGPLSLGGLEIGGLAVDERITVAAVRLSEVDLPGGLAETALQVAGLDVRGTAFDPITNRLSVDAVTIDGLKTAVIRDEAGAWQQVMTPAAPTPPASDDPPAATGEASEQAASPVAWRLGGLQVVGESLVTLADRLNPDMQPLTYRVERFELGEIDSRLPDSDTAFAMTLRPDRFSEFDIAGKMRPLDSQLFLDATGHLHGFGLTSVNGLIADDLGHRFLDGQLDNDFEITITENQLQMANQLSMASMQVEELPEKEGPPIGTAIALLEDRDGNIKLEVPIEGDLNDPSFRVLGALDPIIAKAVAGAAALAIQPLGSVLMVGSLLADQALKVTFDPAPFDAGSTEVNAGARDYLVQLAAKLLERPKLAVRVCGIYAAQERERDEDGKFTDDPETLLVRAQQRADAVKAYMQGEGVAAKQLRKCRPALDPTDTGLPRVDIRF